MIKASHCLVTYFLSVVAGLKLLRKAKILLASIVWLGVAMAVANELNFSIAGFTFQLVASLCECMRLVLTELLLSRAGFKLNALTTIQYYAPLSLVFLVPLALTTEWPSDVFVWLREVEAVVGFHVVIVNGIFAFALNVSAVMLIQRTDAIVYILCGIVKDVLILLWSVIMLDVPVNVQQYLGYSTALLAAQIFNRI